MSAKEAAEEAYHRYCDDFGYSPKNPSHLVTYARSHKLSPIKYVDAKNVISNPPAPKLDLSFDEDMGGSSDNYGQDNYHQISNDNHQNYENGPTGTHETSLQSASANNSSNNNNSNESHAPQTLSQTGLIPSQTASSQPLIASVDTNNDNGNSDNNNINNNNSAPTGSLDTPTLPNASDIVDEKMFETEVLTRNKGFSLTVTEKDLSKWELKQLRKDEARPFMLRVKMVAKSEEAKDQIYKCLQLMADYQLKVPFPGTLVYHFTSPHMVNSNVLTLEFIELYHSEKVFWLHSKTAEIGSAYIKAFQPKNWIKNDTYTIYSPHNDPDNPSNPNESKTNESDSNNTQNSPQTADSSQGLSISSTITGGLPQSIRDCMGAFNSKFCETVAGYLLHPNFKKCLAQRKIVKSISPGPNGDNNNNNDTNKESVVCESGFMIILEIKVPRHHTGSIDSDGSGRAELAAFIKEIYSIINDFGQVAMEYYAIVFSCHPLTSPNGREYLELITIWPNMELFDKYTESDEFVNIFNNRFKPLLIKHNATRSAIKCKLYFEEAMVESFFVIVSSPHSKGGRKLDPNKDDNLEEKDNNLNWGDADPTLVDNINNETNDENNSLQINRLDKSEMQLKLFKKLVDLLHGIGSVKRIQTDIGYILNPLANEEYFEK